MVVYTCIYSEPKRVRLEDHKLEASLGYRAKLSFKKDVGGGWREGRVVRISVEDYTG